jgi:hypothetical protein
MSTEVIAGPLGEVRAASASKGLALTTTAAFVQIPDGARHLFLTAYNFATAVVARFAINPYLQVLFTQNALSTFVDGSQALQDGTTATALTLNSWDTAANLDFVYVGSHLPFRGVNVIIGNTNGTASVLTVKYRKSDNTWADITATDGTASGGATFAQTGNVTWTVPSDWKMDTLVGTGDSPGSKPPTGSPLYWTRWQVSAALDSSVTATGMNALARSTAYAELVNGQAWEQRITKGPGGVANVEGLTDAGTGNLIVNAAAHIGGGFV